MAAGVRSIAVRFIGDTKDLERAGRTGEQSMGRWQKGFQRLNKVATGVLIGVGGAIAGAVTQMVSAGDQIAKAAQNANVSAEEFQELRFAFGQAGINAANFDSSMRRLNRRLGLAAEGGGPAVKAFEALDIAVKGSGGQIRDTTVVLEESLTKLAEIENGAERAALASQLFGEDAGPALAGALDEGISGIEAAREKAQELGIVMDQDALDASEEFSDAMDDLKQVGAGLIRDFATPFLDILTNDILPVLEERVIPAIKSFGDFISENRGLVVTITGVILGLAAAIKVVAAIQAAWNLVMAANPIVFIIALVIALAAIIILNWETIWEFTKKIWNAVWNFLKGLWDTITGFIGDAVGFLKDLFLRFHPLGIIINNWGAITDFVSDQWSKITGFVSDAVSRIGGFLSGMWDGITGTLRSALNGAIGLINSAISGINTLIDGANRVPGVSIPSIPQIPRLHSGGRVPGMPGEEVLILAEAGEEVTPADETAPEGGMFEGQLVLDSGQFLGMVRGMISQSNRDVNRRVLAGAGRVV